jgi:hypothetical protein
MVVSPGVTAPQHHFRQALGEIAADHARARAGYLRWILDKDFPEAPD